METKRMRDRSHDLKNTSCGKCVCVIRRAIYVNQCQSFHQGRDAEMREMQLFGAGRAAARHAQSNCLAWGARG